MGCRAMCETQGDVWDVGRCVGRAAGTGLSACFWPCAQFRPGEPRRGLMMLGRGKSRTPLPCAGPQGCRGGTRPASPCSEPAALLDPAAGLSMALQQLLGHCPRPCIWYGMQERGLRDCAGFVVGNEGRGRGGEVGRNKCGSGAVGVSSDPAPAAVSRSRDGGVCACACISVHTYFEGVSVEVRQ